MTNLRKSFLAESISVESKFDSLWTPPSLFPLVTSPPSVIALAAVFPLTLRLNLDSAGILVAFQMAMKAAGNQVAKDCFELSETATNETQCSEKASKAIESALGKLGQEYSIAAKTASPSLPRGKAHPESGWRVVENGGMFRLQLHEEADRAAVRRLRERDEESEQHNEEGLLRQSPHACQGQCSPQCPSDRNNNTRAVVIVPADVGLVVPLRAGAGLVLPSPLQLPLRAQFLLADLQALPLPRQQSTGGRIRVRLRDLRHLRGLRARSRRQAMPE